MERRGFLSILIVIAIIIAFILVLVRPANKEETSIILNDSPSPPKRGFFIGVLPVPGDNQSFEDAYAQSAQYSDFSPVWGRPSPFYNFAEDLSTSWGQTFVERYIRGNGMFPVIQLSFIGPEVTLLTPPSIKDASLSNPAWRDAYKQAVIDVVKASHPLYLSVGNEVNRWYEKYGTREDDSNGFQHYISLYYEIYDAVKAISPCTKIFCTFAREIVSENREVDLNVLSMFDSDKVDVLVFTSYPYAVRGINRPSDLTDDYYSKALNYMPDKLFGFSELGWPSSNIFGGEQAQADFISQVVGRLTRDRGVNLHLLGWAWLHDLNENDYLGLIKRDGGEKLAYKIWKALSVSDKE
ncbi:MAG: hypothetical protein QXJ17_06920 [Nitrososphaeria archaeon]